MTDPSTRSPAPSVDPSRRALLLGAAIGFLVPMLAFSASAAAMADYWWLGTAVWSAVAFVGVALLFFERTPRVGVGVLLGFAVLLLVGAGTCTAFLAIG